MFRCLLQTCSAWCIALAVLSCGGSGPVIESFTASAEAVMVGESVTLEWRVAAAETCVLAPDIGGVDPESGSVNVTPGNDTTYTLTCSNSTGSSRASVTVNVERNEMVGDWSLTGTVSYERVPSTSAGLDYNAIVVLPIRGARIDVLRDSDESILASTTSDDNGAYSVTWSGSNLVRVRVYSEVAVPPIAVVDNTQGKALYALDSGIVNLSLTTAADVLAASGWDGSEVRGVRAAGPFAILDSVYEAATQFLAERSIEFPALTINWSVDNRPESGSIADGAIGTSFWNGTELFILGKLDVDTDEYDSDVIVHEWGHYFEAKLSRADSVGGPHSFGDVLDPRVAMSEGWGNALSGIIGFPDTLYTDSFGTQQGTAMVWDNDSNTGSHDPNPGWYSESSVQSLVFDAWDEDEEVEPFDNVALGLGGIYDVMSGDFATTPFLTTIFAWLEAAKSEGADPDAIDALAAVHGIDPIVDARGSGEDNDGGVTDGLPLYRDITPGVPQTVAFTAGFAFNTWAQNRYFTFVGNGTAVTVRTEASADVDLFVYEDGNLIAAEESLTGDEQAAFIAATGRRYVIVVTGYNDSGSGTYDVQVRVD